MSKTHSVIREQFLSFTPSLACRLGVEAAVVLQKLVFLCECPNSGTEIDGYKWIWNPMKVWHRSFFPFWSLHTVTRIFEGLEEHGVLVSCQPKGSNRTKYYRISEGMYEKLLKEAAESPCSQNGQLEHARLASCYKDRINSRTDHKGRPQVDRPEGKRRTLAIPYPSSEEDMHRTLETLGLGEVDYMGGFFDQMVKNDWKIRGKPVHNWVETLKARVRITDPHIRRGEIPSWEVEQDDPASEAF